MKLNNQDLLEEFYQEIEEDFPNVSFEQVKEICFGPWRFLKDEMESGNLASVRLKYFGTFQVYPGRAKNMLYNLDKRYNANLIDEKQYLHYKGMIQDYLNKIEKK